MTSGPILETERLILRRWREKDLAPFAAMEADPEVREFYQSTLTQEQTAGLVRKIEDHFERHGFGLWALSTRDDDKFIGFTGLTIPPFDASFMPAVEIGWRLGRAHWGHGYATEAASASVAYGFETLGLDEIVSMAVPENKRSLAVMERLGMTRDPRDDFDHPLLPEGSPLRRHVLYRLHRAQMGS